MLQDAPWIREAETYGIGSDLDDVEIDCPVCQQEADHFWVWEGSDIIGCNHCLKIADSYDDICPVCGQIAKHELYEDDDENVYGCDNCLKPQDAFEWLLKHMDDYK